VVQTNQSKVQIAEVANHRVRCGGVQIVQTVTHETASGAAYTVFEVETTEGSSICVDKVVAICTSRDKGTGDPLEEAQRALVGVSGFDEVRQASANAWDAVWTKIDIQIEGDRQAQKLLRLNLYHCLVSASPHNAEIDAGIPARGLHGEAYRGHIFWDELFILPMYVLHFPEAVRSVLMYRYRRLDAARVYASEHGYEGAMFPWQSGSSGREETQVLHLNPLSGRWGTDNSSLQRHVSLAIAHNIWRYVWATCDTEFLAEYGAEVFLEICRFWASKAQYNEWTGRYEIAKVMGPDEYHEKYPGAEEGGLKDNGYTNIMVAWALCRAHDLVDMLSDHARHELGRRIDLADGELDRWRDIADRIHIPLSEEGILEQFDGYFGLKELDWDGYRARYGDIARMDRLLKAEGKSPDDYKVSKQADALMTFYVLSVAEIREVLKGTGSIVRGGMLKANLEYYLKRTSHGSTLSRLVHSYLANLAGDAALSWQFYLEALESDFVDIQGGTTGEGIHTGVMAGTAVLALKAYAGLDLAGDVVRIDPRLPAGWREVCFNIGFQGGRYYFVVSPERVDVKVDCIREGPVDIVVRGRKSSLIPSEWTRVDLAEGES
jgi:trehalose/maltose hydrolase-like predicted phosphorylase